MTLKNLAKVGKLETHETDAEQVKRLLTSIERSITDAKADVISEETRFTAAYQAIMNCAMLALWSNGYRPSKSETGHHQTMIQSLVKSIRLDPEEMPLLDTFRVKRNAIEYTGEMIDGVSLTECVAAAERLLEFLLAWLEGNRPDLIA